MNVLRFVTVWGIERLIEVNFDLFNGFFRKSDESSVSFLSQCVKLMNKCMYGVVLGNGKM